MSQSVCLKIGKESMPDRIEHSELPLPLEVSELLAKDKDGSVAPAIVDALSSIWLVHGKEFRALSVVERSALLADLLVKQLVQQYRPGPITEKQTNIIEMISAQLAQLHHILNQPLAEHNMAETLQRSSGKTAPAA